MDDGASSADSDVTSKTPTPRGGGGIGRPATTGAYVGLAKAKAEYLTQCEKEMELKVKKEATEITHHIRKRRLANPLSEYVITSEILTLDLCKRAQEWAEAIRKVAKISKNLKGTSKKAKFSESIGEVLGALHQRTSTEEMRRQTTATKQKTPSSALKSRSCGKD